MIVYVDILIVLNLIVDYLLLNASATFLSMRVRTFRLISAAVIGAFSSLYIFIPNVSLLFEGVYKFFICALMSITAFGYGSFRRYLKASAVLFIITCGYAGAMFAVWHIFRPNGMVINNGVVYFDISPLVLIIVTVVSYFVFIFMYKILSRTAKTAESCNIELYADGKTNSFRGILDTGNSVVDMFGSSEIIVADKSVLEELFGETDINKNKEILNRYRLIPCSTVSGDGMLEAFRCDKANVSANGKSIVIEKPIVAISKTAINDNYLAVLNPKILE